MNGAKTKITVKKKYLVMPVGHHVSQRRVSVFSDGELRDSFDIRLDYANPYDCAFYDVSEYAGSEIEISVSDGVEFSDLQSDTEKHDGSSIRNYRPAVHFTPEFGWINDPNGLLFYESPVTGKKTWHMFYQFNPYDDIWGNMHWGHAVSEDLIHWSKKDPALFPDGLGTMFSGSAITDERNVSGLRDGGEHPILLFYTAAGGSSLLSSGKQFTQCMAYSTDGGETFQKYGGNPIIGHIRADNRDPKVIWCDELSRYVLALYLDGNTFSLFASDNLIDWEHLQDMVIANDAECPDIFPLPVNGNPKNRKWVISAASGRYQVCEVRNGLIDVIQDSRPLEYSSHAYAAQTFSGVPDGRRIGFSWDRDIFYPAAGFNGQMSVPYELSLRFDGTEYTMCREPAGELASIRKNEKEYASVTVTPEKPFSLRLDKMAYDVVIDVSRFSSPFDIVLLGKTVSIDTEHNIVTVGNTRFPLTVSGERHTLRMIIDTCTAEFFLGGGEACSTIPFLGDYNLNRITVMTTGRTELTKIKISELVP